jgi:hypothetical protein
MEKKPKTSPEGRKCKLRSCRRSLSIYNHSVYCRVHRDQVAWEQIRKTTYHHRGYPVL